MKERLSRIRHGIQSLQNLFAAKACKEGDLVLEDLSQLGELL